MKFLPSYLAPVPVTESNGLPSQVLRRLQQSTASVACGLLDVKEASERWKGLSQEERDAATKETGLSAVKISAAAKSLIDAEPKDAVKIAPATKKPIEPEPKAASKKFK